MPEHDGHHHRHLYEAWNRHDAAAIAGSFAAGGVSADPLTRVDLSGDNLTNRVPSLLEVRTIAEGDVEAQARVTWPSGIRCAAG